VPTLQVITRQPGTTPPAVSGQREVGQWSKRGIKLAPRPLLLPEPARLVAGEWHAALFQDTRRAGPGSSRGRGTFMPLVLT
jgi:hypothetical protein